MQHGNQIDSLCDEFEACWKKGNRPKIADFVQRADTEVQAQLQKELVRLDLEYQLELDPGLGISRYLQAFGLNRSDVNQSEVTTEQPTGSVKTRTVMPVESEIGRFRIERILGSGGFGVVYLAHDSVLKRKVALKVPKHILDAAAKDRFLREAEAIASLDHPAIVAVFEAGEIDDVCFIATAFCDGPTLSQWKARQESIPALVAVQIVKRLAEAMQHAHSRGVIHRDLKPSNVLMVSNDDTGKGFPFDIFLTDFGLAKVLQQELEDTNSSVVMGTPAYMAPEQLNGEDNSTALHSADIYSLGVILFELLTGQRPFEASSVVAVMDAIRTQPVPDAKMLRPDLPRDLATVCTTCLQKLPEDRYPTCDELIDDLHRVETGVPVAARRPGIKEISRRVLAEPDRAKEAGLLSFLMGVIVPVWVTFSISLTVWFDLIPEIRGDLVSQAALLSFLLMAPLGWTGYRTWQGSLKWARIGFVFAVFNLIVCALPLLGPTLVFPELYARYPVARVIIYSLLTLIYIVQVFQYAVVVKFSKR